jgi:hypothetical protein
MMYSNDSQPRVGSNYWLPGQQFRSAPRGYIALMWALCAALLLSGCGIRANRNIKLVKRIDLARLSPAAVAVQGDLAYVANHSDLTVLDVSDPLNPQRIAFYLPEPNWRDDRSVFDVVVDGHYAYLAANGLVVVDISDPHNPKGLYTYDIDGFAFDVKVKEHYAYLAGLSNGLLIFDVSQPSQPELVSQVYNIPDRRLARRTSDSVEAVDFVGQYAYVVRESEWTKLVDILDITDPASPKNVARYTPEKSPWDIVVQGHYAYLNAQLNYIDVVDVSDPLAPHHVGSVKTPGHIRQHTVDGDYVYVADSFNISIIDVSNPKKPRVVGFYDISIGPTVAKVGDYLYARAEAEPPLIHIFEFNP